MADLLVVDRLCMSYGSVTALDTVSLSIREGEFITLLGPSGSGKTTLLMSIAGFTRPTAGDILFDGRQITPLDPEDRDFGLVFQGYALFPHLSVAENIAFPLRIRKWPAARIRERVAQMLALVGLEAFAARKPRQLSGGQQQRVALARALSFGPRVLLLDEPLSALDRMLRETMQQELRRLHRETGVTFLYVTHDQQEALTMSDRVAVFERGRLVEFDTAQRLFRAPRTRFVASFLGENNLVRGRRRSGIWEAFGTRFALPPERDLAADTASATVWLRPGDIAAGPGPEGSVRFSAQVRDAVFLGTQGQLHLALPDGETILASLPADQAGPELIGQDRMFHARPSAIGALPPETVT